LAVYDDAGDEVSERAAAEIPDASWGAVQSAKKYPRSVKAFLVQAEALATVTQQVAMACIYSVPRAGKQLTGPSVRLAEICASAWGNMRIGARIAREEANYIVAQGYAHDLQTNTECSFEVRRRITDRNGKRYSDDMIAVTANAAQAIALRNAVFRVVPKALVDAVFERARLVAVGEQKTLGERRAKMVEYFAKLGVGADKLLGLTGKASVEDMDGEDLLTLHGLANAIKDGTVGVEQAFPAPEQPAAKRLADRLGAGKAPPKDGERPGEEPAPANGRLFGKESEGVGAIR
jgi:hypothetical protein